MKKICKNCKYWKEGMKYHGVTKSEKPRGECLHRKFVHGLSFYPPGDDFLIYWDWIETCPEFGCIHWRPKK
ncbi:MAG: hypothetical protein ACTSYY_12870 [Promethearchaeota archaeon]